jgi:hypothetical protein
MHRSSFSGVSATRWSPSPRSRAGFPRRFTAFRDFHSLLTTAPVIFILHRPRLLQSLHNATVCYTLRGASRLDDWRRQRKQPGKRSSALRRRNGSRHPGAVTRSRWRQSIRWLAALAAALGQPSRRSRDGWEAESHRLHCEYKFAKRARCSTASGSPLGGGSLAPPCDSRRSARRSGWLLRALIYCGHRANYLRQITWISAASSPSFAQHVGVTSTLNSQAD